MVQSINTKVDLVIEATSHLGLPEYGKIMIGDKGFEFYNSRNAHKFIQIHWEEVDYMIASVIFRGKGITCYAIETKRDDKFILSSKNPNKLLHIIRNDINRIDIIHSLLFLI